MCRFLFSYQLKSHSEIDEKRFLNSLDLMIKGGPDSQGYAFSNNRKNWNIEEI